MRDNRFECGCERGGDCTKTTMCQLQTAIEDEQDRIAELEAGCDSLHEHIAAKDRIIASQRIAHEQDAARIAELESQCEVLQNRCATRGLSPEDSDALMAENERLRAIIIRAYDLVKLGRYQMADSELRKALAAQEKDNG